MTSVDDRSILSGMAKQDKKAEIIGIGMELISLNGYNATGIDKVLKAAGVPKGSFYHYFGSKEDFGLAVIDAFARDYNARLDSFFLAGSRPPLERIRNYFEAGLMDMTAKAFTKGCLIGNLGQELADQNERFRARLEVIFNGWRLKFGDCLEAARKEGSLATDLDCDVVAEFILSGWEGAVLRAKVMKSPEPLRHFIDTLFATVLKAG